MAAAAYRKAVALAPKDFRAYNNLAFVLVEQKKDLDEAFRAAKQANELAPKRGEVLDTLGWAYYHKGMYGDAMSALKEAVALLPQNSTVRYHLAVTYLKAGQKSEAAAELRRALTTSTTFPEARQAREALDSLGG